MAIEEMRARIFYHVTCTRQYKAAFKKGETVSVGVEYNPFFGFYERPMSHRVNYLDGRVEMLSTAEYLRRIAEGTVTDNNLPVFTRDMVSHFYKLSRELLMEQVRTESYPLAPSRQRCLYVADTLEHARTWKNLLGGTTAICSVEFTGAALTVDSNLLMSPGESLSETRERAHLYWKGEVSQSPQMETLLRGQLKVLEVDVS